MKATTPRRRAVESGAAFWLLAVAAFAAAVFALRGARMLGDPDSYWHVTAGRRILESFAIPTTDVFSHSMNGEAWAMTHEWLAQVLLAWVFDAGGWPAAAALTASVAALGVMLLAFYLMRRLTPAQVAIACILAVLLAFPHVLVRPHILSWPIMVVWVAELVGAADDDRAPPLWLLPVMAVWANLHGSFVLGLAICGFLAGEALLRGWRPGGVLPALRRWGGFALAAGLVTLVTPHALERLAAIATYMGNPVQMGIIMEWRSPDFQRFQPLLLWMALLVGVTALTTIRLPFTRVVALLGLLYMALRHQRYVELVGFLGPILLAAPVGAHFAARAGSRAAKLPPRWALPLAGALVLVPPSIHFATRDVAPHPGLTPSAALAAVRAAGIGGPVLNSYEFGGFLIHEGVPTFIDGRADLFGDVFVSRFVGATGLSRPEALAGLLEEYAVDWTLLAPGTPAIALLDRLPGWRRLHADDVAVVHVREVRADTGGGRP